MNKEEIDDLLNKMAVWEDTASAVSSAQATRTTSIGSLSDAFNALQTQEGQENLDMARRFASFQELRVRQENQRNRLLMWDDERKTELYQQCVARETETESRLEREKEELLEKVCIGWHSK